MTPLSSEELIMRSLSATTLEEHHLHFDLPDGSGWEFYLYTIGRRGNPCHTVDVWAAGAR